MNNNSLHPDTPDDENAVDLGTRVQGGSLHPPEPDGSNLVYLAAYKAGHRGPEDWGPPSAPALAPKRRSEGELFTALGAAFDQKALLARIPALSLPGERRRRKNAARRDAIGPWIFDMWIAGGRAWRDTPEVIAQRIRNSTAWRVGEAEALEDCRPTAFRTYCIENGLDYVSRDQDAAA